MNSKVLALFLVALFAFVVADESEAESRYDCDPFNDEGTDEQAEAKCNALCIKESEKTGMCFRVIGCLCSVFDVGGKFRLSRLIQ